MRVKTFFYPTASKIFLKDGLETRQEMLSFQTQNRAAAKDNTNRKEK
jgi:hypothetical protein